ncbi:hypothetical protein QFC22_001081 [Naganishia vaughanmartiniae]|uniref:Uncharacterized protein n=1 Tax=Naganishia vaughanmartiniae TaxID=1424756 RepID=A0ACC2XKV9_9TREE|nr:hypothetical protein QFC22_001081 [Naganishia vaughanmartiniae]
MVWGPLAITFAPQLKALSPGLFESLRPLANLLVKASGYRSMGLKYDDLLMEEREDVQKAISRLTPQQAYNRAFRIRTAIQQSILHKPLPREHWVKPEEDVRYMTPLVREIEAENAERAFYDTAKVERK